MAALLVKQARKSVAGTVEWFPVLIDRLGYFIFSYWLREARTLACKMRRNARQIYYNKLLGLPLKSDLNTNYIACISL